MTDLTTVKAVCAAARTRLAALPCARNAGETFIPYNGAMPFRQAPAGKRESFQITDQRMAITNAFGVSNAKEQTFRMVIELGHAPAGKEDARNDWVSRDADRIADTLERETWAPAGTMGVFYEPETTTTIRDNASWWITQMTFRVVLLAAVEVT